jgi:hypothetical protein
VNSEFSDEETVTARAGIAPVQQRATGWTTGFRYRAGVRGLLLHSVQTDSGVRPASYPIGPGVTQTGLEADHSLPSSVEVKNGGATTPLPNMSSSRGV